MYLLRMAKGHRSALLKRISMAVKGGYETRLSVGISAGSPSSKQKMKSSPKLIHKLKIAKMDGVGLV